jgi:hypothetical protein
MIVSNCNKTFKNRSILLQLMFDTKRLLEKVKKSWTLKKLSRLSS